MRRRLVRHWPTLWTQFGVRPMDVGDLTIYEVASMEASIEAWATQAQAAAAQARLGSRGR